MIQKGSFELYEKLVASDNYSNIFDLSIILQVNETIENYGIETNNLYTICNEVKRQYLKYEDVTLNDDLVLSIIDELKEKGVI